MLRVHHVASDGKTSEMLVRESVVRACSPVIDGFLADGAAHDNAERCLTFEGCSHEEFVAFLTLLKHTAYEHGDEHGRFGIDEIAAKAPLLLPLIHKYDCTGLYVLVRDAVREQPALASIIALEKFGVSGYDLALTSAELDTLLAAAAAPNSSDRTNELSSVTLSGLLHASVAKYRALVDEVSIWPQTLFNFLPMHRDVEASRRIDVMARDWMRDKVAKLD